MHQVMSGVVGLVAVLALTLGLVIWTSRGKGSKSRGKRG